MSANKKVTNPRVPKKTQPEEPVVAAPVVTPPPVVAAPPAPAPVVEATPESDDDHKVRLQTNKAIGVSISAARVRRHFDKLGLNAGIDGRIAVLKEENAPYTTAVKTLEKLTADSAPAEQVAAAQSAVDKLAPAANVNADRISALSRERTRLTTDTSVCLSVICDEMAAELAKHAMDNVLEAGMKIIKVSNIHSAGVDKLSLYPLFAPLPLFASTASQTRALLLAESAAAERALLLSQAEKDFKKKYGVKAAKEAAAAPSPKVLEVPAVEEEDNTDSKVSFKHYIGQLCKEVAKQDVKYKSIRISTEFREYVSDLVTEFIERLAPLVQCTANSMKNKTVSDIAIMRTIENLLIDGHKAVETIELRDEEFPDPAAVKVAVAARDAAKAAGEQVKKLDLSALPKVKGFVAVRTITYPTSGYSRLNEVVKDKLKIYREYNSQ